MENGGRDLDPDILVGVRIDERETDQEHVGLGV